MRRASVALLVFLNLAAVSFAIERVVPVPRADHPGNVFLDSETVRIVVPEWSAPRKLIQF